MVLQYSSDGHLLYVRFRDGDAAETAEVAPDVYVDLDADGDPLGVEFLNADDFFRFMREQLERRGADLASTVVEVPGTLERMLEQRLREMENAASAVAAT